jgi:hypothetical protein
MVEGTSIAHYQQLATGYLVPKSQLGLLSTASLLQAYPYDITLESDKLILSGILSKLTKGSSLLTSTQITIYWF